MDHNEILPHLHVGSCPRSGEDIDRLKQEAGVTAVVNLQTSGDFTYWEIDWPVLEAHYHEAGVEVRWLPIQDFNREALRENLPRCVEAVDGLMQNGHIVYVHCNVVIPVTLHLLFCLGCGYLAVRLYSHRRRKT